MTREEIDQPYSSNKSNRQVIETVPLGLIKLPDQPIKPLSAKAIAVCKANMERYGQPRPIVVDDKNRVLERLSAYQAGHTNYMINFESVP